MKSGLAKVDANSEAAIGIRELIAENIAERGT
jgi:hypothetical protein